MFTALVFLTISAVALVRHAFRTLERDDAEYRRLRSEMAAMKRQGK